MTAGAASLFGRVTVGLGGAQMGCKGVVGQKLLMLGTGSIDLLMSVTQFNVVFMVQSASGGTYAVNGILVRTEGSWEKVLIYFWLVFKDIAIPF
jgi:hypothetical protein